MEPFSRLSFPNAPFIKVEPPGPLSKNFLDFQNRHEGSAVSYPRGLPMALKRGLGATVEDVDGNVYIDFFGGAGVLNVGHANPGVISAAQDQMTLLTHALDIPTPAKKRLIELLMPLLPDEVTRVFFGGPSGSDAVESAIKLAKYHSQKHPLVAFEGSYHGMTSGALSVCSGSPFKEEFLPLLAEVHFIPYAYCYRCAFEKSPHSCELLCARYLEHKLEDPHTGISTPAAVIIEPIQGEGGTIVPPDSFLPEIRKICDKFGILLIVDEIQSGFCRTGTMFAYQHGGIVPDIITMSKALGGIGFPISCIAFKETLNTLPPGKHIGTFRGNVIAYAAGAAAIDFMTENRLAEHAEHLGNKILSILADIQRHSRIIGDVRGRGLMLGVELVRDRESKEPAPELANSIRQFCHQKGLLVEIGGHYFNVIRFLPPLVITEELVLKGMDIFRDAVRSMEN